MKKDLILFGNGDFAELMMWYIENDDSRKIVAVTVEEKYISGTDFRGVPQIAFEKLQEKYSPEEYDILIGVGYNHMNDIRKRIFEKCKNLGYNVASYIHSSTRLSDVQMGEGNIIFEDTLIEPFVKIGRGNIIWCKISIAHNCIIGNFNTIAGTASLCGFSEIRDNCFIGNGSVVRDKIKVESYTLVGAAAYVASDTEEFNVVVANKGVVLPNKSSRDFL